MSWLLLRLVISMHGLNMKFQIYFSQYFIMLYTPYLSKLMVIILSTNLHTALQHTQFIRSETRIRLMTK